MRIACVILSGSRASMHVWPTYAEAPHMLRSKRASEYVEEPAPSPRPISGVTTMHESQHFIAAPTECLLPAAAFRHACVLCRWQHDRSHMIWRWRTNRCRSGGAGAHAPAGRNSQR